MAKRVKWNIHVEHEVVFLWLSLLWGFSEDVLYLDNYTMLFCIFELIYLCISLDILWDVCLWNYIFHQISSIKLLRYKVYGIRFRSEIICSSYRITIIVLWAKPFVCEKVNKREPMFLSSLYFGLLAKTIWQTTETYSPQTFSVTAAVVAPAVVICLNSLIFRKRLADACQNTSTFS